VSLPNPIGEGTFTVSGQNGGFLGAPYAPLTVNGDPNEDHFTVDGLSAGNVMGPDRLGAYQGLLETVNQERRWLGADHGVAQMTSHQQRALDLLTSQATRRAFEIDREPARVRDRYGRNKIGQSLVLARRLVEAGVRLVTVYWGGKVNNPLPYWDTHENLAERLQNELLPPLDRGFSAFLEDMQARGLLESTLIACLGEFGRTPRIGQFTGNGASATGRDHWPHCYPLVVAGGKTNGGRAIGKSDNFAAYPADEPYAPQDLGATILHLLGVNPNDQVRDGFGRNVPLSTGRFCETFFGK